MEAYVPSNLRSQLERTARNLLVLDTYNANPSSMRASLSNFAASKFPDKMLILGEMLELGQDSVQEHVRVMETAAGIQDCSRILLVGGEFLRAAGECPSAAVDSRFTFCRDVEEARKVLEEKPAEGCTVLLKGSNAVHLPLLKNIL